MNKIGSMTLDVVDFVINEQIDKLAEAVSDLSDDASTAYVPSYEEQAEMPEKDFGLVLWHPKLGKFNKFALHNPGITEINLSLLSSNSKNLPEEIVKIAGANLGCAAKKFDIKIPDNIEKYASDRFIENKLDIRNIDEARYIVKTSQPDKSEIFALPEEKKYPIDTKDDVVKAAAYFKKYCNNLTPDNKLTFALNVMKQSKKLGVDLSGTILERYTNVDVNRFNDDFSDHIKVRIDYLSDNDDESKEAYSDLLDRSGELGPNKTAIALYNLDLKSGLSKEYGHGIEDSILSTFYEKETDGEEIDDVFVTKKSLKNIPLWELTRLVGNDLVSELHSEKGLDTLKNLPTPVRREVMELM